MKVGLPSSRNGAHSLLHCTLRSLAPEQGQCSDLCLPLTPDDNEPGACIAAGHL